MVDRRRSRGQDRGQEGRLVSRHALAARAGGCETSPYRADFGSTRTARRSRSTSTAARSSSTARAATLRRRTRARTGSSAERPAAAASPSPRHRRSVARASREASRSTLERKYRTIYSTLQNGERQNYFGDQIYSSPTTLVLRCTDLAQADPGRSSVVVQGLSSEDHRSQSVSERRRARDDDVSRTGECLAPFQAPAGTAP